ncbi:Pyridoxal phosphate-dependent transferase, major domain [Sesbania bispinosa]|nr:Pyridoxal phosphate-dependent transferase, major domain [Sesbania bispinosa]
MSDSETDVTTSIKKFVKSNYGFSTDSSTEFIYAENSKALFNKLVLCCIKEGGTLCFPAGSNGNYVSSARFLKADIVTVPTDVSVGFKFTEKTLNGVLGTVKNPWVYISGPTVNPTGLVYSNNEIGEILSICARFGARVIIDTSSSGLEFDCEGWGGWDLAGCLSTLNSSSKPSFCVSLLGGLSLKMLNGVLRFGFLILNQSALVDTLYSYPGLSKPHSTVRYAVKKLLELREQKPSILSDAIVEHTRILRSRFKSLKEALEKSGWDVLKSCAGVSVVAKPSAYLNKTVKLKISPEGEGSQGNAIMEITLDDSNIRNAILKATGLCINSGSWTGIPGYCRFNIALEENDFKRALDCILKFKEAALH